MKIEVTQEIRGYMSLIDRKYAEAKAKRISRLDMEWGKWSTKMNRETKAKIETGTHPQKDLLKYIFNYWVNRSQLLELHHKSRFLKRAHKVRLAREGRKIKRLILSGDIPDATSFDRMQSVLGPLSNKKCL